MKTYTQNVKDALLHVINHGALPANINWQTRKAIMNNDLIATAPGRDDWFLTDDGWRVIAPNR